MIFRDHLCRRCWHPRSAHRHYRRGTDCADQAVLAEGVGFLPPLLGPCDCRRYRRPRLLDLLAYR